MHYVFALLLGTSFGMMVGTALESNVAACAASFLTTLVVGAVLDYQKGNYA